MYNISITVRRVPLVDVTLTLSSALRNRTAARPRATELRDWAIFNAIEGWSLTPFLF